MYDVDVKMRRICDQHAMCVIPIKGRTSRAPCKRSHTRRSGSLLLFFASMTVGLTLAFIDLCVRMRTRGIGMVALPSAAAPTLLVDQAHFGPFAIPTFRNLFGAHVSIFQLHTNDADTHPVTGWRNRDIEVVASCINHFMNISSMKKREQAFTAAHNTQYKRGADLLRIALGKMMSRRISNALDNILDNQGLGFDSLIHAFEEVRSGQAPYTSHDVHPLFRCRTSLARTSPLVTRRPPSSFSGTRDC
jgi:hypothetical protein